MDLTPQERKARWDAVEQRLQQLQVSRQQRILYPPNTQRGRIQRLDIGMQEIRKITSAAHDEHVKILRRIHEQERKFEEPVPEDILQTEQVRFQASLASLKDKWEADKVIRDRERLLQASAKLKEIKTREREEIAKREKQRMLEILLAHQKDQLAQLDGSGGEAKVKHSVSFDENDIQQEPAVVSSIPMYAKPQESFSSNLNNSQQRPPLALGDVWGSRRIDASDLEDGSMTRFVIEMRARDEQLAQESAAFLDALTASEEQDAENRRRELEAARQERNARIDENDAKFNEFMQQLKKARLQHHGLDQKLAAKRPSEEEPMMQRQNPPLQEKPVISSLPAWQNLVTPQVERQTQFPKAAQDEPKTIAAEEKKEVVSTTPNLVNPLSPEKTAPSAKQQSHSSPPPAMAYGNSDDESNGGSGDEQIADPSHHSSPEHNSFQEIQIASNDIVEESVVANKSYVSPYKSSPVKKRRNYIDSDSDSDSPLEAQTIRPNAFGNFKLPPKPTTVSSQQTINKPKVNLAKYSKKEYLDDTVDTDMSMSAAPAKSAPVEYDDDEFDF